MKNEIIEHGSNQKPSFLEIACEKVGFFFFRIIVKINDLTNYCLERSTARDRLKKAVDDLGRKEEIGEKVVAYDEGIADVITDPIETLMEQREEIYDCHEAVQALFYAWQIRDEKLMDELFSRFGFNQIIEEN